MSQLSLETSEGQDGASEETEKLEVWIYSKIVRVRKRVVSGVCLQW